MAVNARYFNFIGPSHGHLSSVGSLVSCGRLPIGQLVALAKTWTAVANLGAGRPAQCHLVFYVWDRAALWEGPCPASGALIPLTLRECNTCGELQGATLLGRAWPCSTKAPGFDSGEN